MANEKDPQTATKETPNKPVEAASTGGPQASAGPKVEDKGKEAADKGREAAGRTAEAARRSSEAGMEAVRRTTETGASAARQGAETFRDATRNTTNTAFAAAAQTTEQFQRLFGLNKKAQDDAYRTAQQDMEKVFEAGTILMDGVQAAWKDWLDLSQESLKRHVEGVNSMMRCRTVQDFYAAQSDLVRDEFQLWLDCAGKITNKAAETTGHAAQALREHNEQSKHASQRVY